jgi:hypothetical protein
MAFNLSFKHVCYISMCIIREYVTMTGLLTKYAIGSCGVRLVQITVVQLGYRFMMNVIRIGGGERYCTFLIVYSVLNYRYYIY